MGLNIFGKHPGGSLLYGASPEGENRYFRAGDVYVHWHGVDAPFHRSAMVLYEATAQKRSVLGNI